MREQVLSTLALHVFDLRFFVMLAVVLGVALAVAGTWAQARPAHVGNLPQAAVAVSTLPRPVQFMLAYLLVRVCLCATVLWTHDVHGALLPLALFFGSITSGVVARDVRGTVRGVLIDAIVLALLVAHALVSNYLALVPPYFALWAVAGALALLATLLSLVALLADARRLLDAVPLATDKGASHAS